MREVAVFDNRNNESQIAGEVLEVRRVESFLPTNEVDIVIMLDTGFNIYLPVELIDKLVKVKEVVK